jgi:hypothetical protein
MQASDNDLFKKGYLDVTLYNGWQGNPVDPKGVKDSTVALQKALDDAHDYQLTAYFPSGTYLVSDTLHFVKKYGGGLRHRFSTTLVGSTQGKRPVIRLKDNAKGFNDPNQAKPILAVWRLREPAPFGTPGNKVGDPEGGGNAQFATGYLQRIQGIEIHCGSANAGAIGLFFRAAQNSYIQDVNIIATGAFAGFYGIPSRTSAGAANIKVEGGQYGIYLPDYDAGSIIVGAVLHHQVIEAIHTENFAPISVVGFDIIKDNGPVISLIKGSGSKGTMNLLDGRVKIVKGGAAFDNPDGRNLYIRNVYVTGSDELIATQGSITKASGTWKHIAEFSHNAGQGKSFNLINGKINNEAYKSIENNASPPPPDLLSRHIWRALPSFEDLGIINAAAFGATGDDKSDDTKAIQGAIDKASTDPIANGRVFLPKGLYYIRQTLNLHDNSMLFGVATHLTWIITHSRWRPSELTPMIQTVDDAKASTYLGNLSLQYELSKEGDCQFNPLHWRAGRNSMVMGVFTYAGGPGKKTLERQEFRITDNGGGRWYFMGFHQHKGTAHPNYRALYIDGTTEPLWFYGLNIEHVKADYQAEIRNAKNIRIFGPKVEGSARVMRIHNTTNLALYGAGALRNPPRVRNGALFDITGNSDNILLANINPSKNRRPGGPQDHTVRDVNDVGVAYPNMVALFKRGVLDDSVMVHSADLSLEGDNSKPSNEASRVDINQD